MQGDPLKTIAYGIGILPVINNLKRQITDSNQPQIADNAVALGEFTRIETYFNSLTRQGPGRGCHPKPTKSILIVLTENLEAGRLFSKCHGFKVCTSAHYIRCYIGDYASKSNWLRQCTLTWEKNIGTIRKTAGKYPQESYATVSHSIQSELIYIQRITWGTGCVSAGVQKMLQETFLPRIFYGETISLSPNIGDLSTMPTKNDRLGLLNLSASETA